MTKSPELGGASCHKSPERGTSPGPIPGARKRAASFSSALRGVLSPPASPRTSKTNGAPEADQEREPQRSRRHAARSSTALPFESFSPPPNILQTPIGCAEAPPAGGSGVDLAGIQAMADRLLESVSIGEDGTACRALRLRLRPTDGAASVSIQLTERGGGLHVEVDSESGDRCAALAFAGRIAEELRGRGLDTAEIEIVC